MQIDEICICMLSLRQWKQIEEPYSFLKRKALSNVQRSFANWHFIKEAAASKLESGKFFLNEVVQC